MEHHQLKASQNHGTKTIHLKKDVFCKAKADVGLHHGMPLLENISKLPKLCGLGDLSYIKMLLCNVMTKTAERRGEGSSRPSSNVQKELIK